MATDEEHLGVGRPCRQCGARSDTLGTVCPRCRRPYDGPGGLLERIPLWVWVAVVAVALVVLIENAIAGILILAATFVALVAAIGVSNALNDRGR